MTTFNPLGSVVSVASNGNTSPPLRDPWPPFRGPCAARADVRVITSATAQRRDGCISPLLSRSTTPARPPVRVPSRRFETHRVPHHATGAGLLDVVLSDHCIRMHLAADVLSHLAHAEHVRRDRPIPGGGFGNGGHLLRP